VNSVAARTRLTFFNLFRYFILIEETGFKGAEHAQHLTASGSKGLKAT